MVNAPMPSRPAPHPPQDNNQAQAHRLPVQFSGANKAPLPRFLGPRQPARTNLGGGDPLHIIRDIQRGWRHPMGQGTPGHMQHGFNPLDVLGATARQLAHSMNPTTRGGIANLAAMFAPGARGGGYGSDPLPEDVLYKWNPSMQFKNYDHQTGSPLDRGVPNEGPNPGAQGAGIRGLVRRAQGVGGYQRPNEGLAEMGRLEAIRKEQSQLSQSRQKLQDFSNRRSFELGMLRTNARMEQAAEQNMGAKLIPYRYTAQNAPQFKEGQSADFMDRNTLIKLHQQMPGNPLLGAKTPVLQALYDMLFSGKGFKNLPPRP